MRLNMESYCIQNYLHEAKEADNTKLAPTTMMQVQEDRLKSKMLNTDGMCTYKFRL